MSLCSNTLNTMPKLGFGLMRLPKLESGDIDVEQVKEMTDLFLGAGMKYFDTAYVYGDGDSEKAIREALVERYRRDSYFLATKLCAWQQCHDETSAKQQFYTSLERTGAGYFDFYLLHAIQSGNYRKYDEYHLWDFIIELKEKGLIRHYGFSFHATPDLLEGLLSEHPDVDFIQLQVNYVDLDNPDVQSRKNMEVARRHGIPFVIMEPIKGGMLSNLAPAAEKILKDVHPDMSIASWAIRFASSMPGALVVLSGMSDVKQMKDNISYMKDFKPLDNNEFDAIETVRKILGSYNSIPCTACRYCTGGCPQQIPIPDIFKAVNLHLRDHRPLKAARKEYEKVTLHGRGAPDCIKCGQCESSCPQQLKIVSLLEKAACMFA